MRGLISTLIILFGASQATAMERSKRAASTDAKIIEIESSKVIDVLNKKSADLDKLVAPSKKLEEEKDVSIESVTDVTFGLPESSISVGGSALTVSASKFYYMTGYSFSTGSRLYRIQRKGCSKTDLAKIIEEQKKVYTRSVPLSGEIRKLGVVLKPKDGRSVEMFEISAKKIGLDDDLVCSGK